MGTRNVATVFSLKSQKRKNEIMTSVLEKLMQMQSLDFETSQNLAERFISGDLAPEMVAGLLVALQIKVSLPRNFLVLQLHLDSSVLHLKLITPMLSIAVEPEEMA